ncbi:MAG: murein biosynthesis integral membrane protein MurJ, partial [Nocardioides sp.]
MSDDAGADERASVLASSAVMAAGTVVSRLSGYGRTVLLAAALGNVLHADIFNLANTVPNMLYILLAGGVFNAVLVPQLVRSMNHDEDDGDAYANRVVTLAVVFLGAVTVLLVVAAPLVMDLFLDSAYDEPALAAQRESVIDFARYCLPQVFFYGMFVLVGQILNARGRFGPMMWAPIANNVIAVLMLVVYLGVFGQATLAEQDAGFSPGQELLLGLGSTVGIAVQLLVLLPYLGAAGFHYRPRFDFRHTGLGHTLRLGFWTVCFVIVNQIAYWVVVQLASGGTAQAQLSAAGGGAAEQGTGYTIYTYSFLIIMVPHAVVTVSLATAILPRLAARAAEADLAGLARGLAQTLRTALAVVLPFAALVPVIARDLANGFFGWGAGRDTFALYEPVLSVFGPALVVFTVHYLMLRGFYALERTRTVFFVQCGIAAVNIIAAVLLVRSTDARGTAAALAGAYLTAYAVGSLASYLVLGRVVGGLETPALLRFLVRVAIAVAAGTAAA